MEAPSIPAELIHRLENARKEAEEAEAAIGKYVQDGFDDAVERKDCHYISELAGQIHRIAPRVARRMYEAIIRIQDAEKAK